LLKTSLTIQVWDPDQTGVLVKTSSAASAIPRFAW
jgi:hypothetical protein